MGVLCGEGKQRCFSFERKKKQKPKKYKKKVEKEVEEKEEEEEEKEEEEKEEEDKEEEDKEEEEEKEEKKPKDKKKTKNKKMKKKKKREEEEKKQKEEEEKKRKEEEEKKRKEEEEKKQKEEEEKKRKQEEGNKETSNKNENKNKRNIGSAPPFAIGSSKQTEHNLDNIDKKDIETDSSIENLNISFPHKNSVKIDEKLSLTNTNKLPYPNLNIIDNNPIISNYPNPHKNDNIPLINYPENNDLKYEKEEDEEIEEENEIIYDKIFFDGNSKNYDMILNFYSFDQLNKDGWTANFSIEGEKKYLKSIKEENIVIGVVGIKNRGKSFLLKRIMDNKNYNPQDGFLVTTHGISCGFPILEDNESFQTFITLDTAGRDNPLLQNVYCINKKDYKSIVREQKICEILLSEFIIKESNVLIAVIEQLSFAEQEMLRNLIQRLKKKEVDKIDKRKLIVIHNLMNIKKAKEIDKFIRETMLNSLTFSLVPQYVEDHEDPKYNLFVYIQTMDNDKELNNDSKLDIVHLVVGNDDEEDVKTKYNEPAFKYIRDYIKIDSLKSFDILNSFKNFIVENSKTFMNDKFFIQNSLIIGEKVKKKVYVDKDKKIPPETKIIIPIKTKDNINIENFSFKPFYFGADGTYYFSNGIDPLYSSKIIKKNNNEYYLQIIFEMPGKIENLKYEFQYHDKQIIIEIEGKINEINILEIEEKIINEQGNLKFTDFDFQIKIDKYIKQKRIQIEMKEDTVDRNFDENYGIYTLLFPINIYPI